MDLFVEKYNNWLKQFSEIKTFAFNTPELGEYGHLFWTSKQYEIKARCALEAYVKLENVLFKDDVLEELYNSGFNPGLNVRVKNRVIDYETLKPSDWYREFESLNEYFQYNDHIIFYEKNQSDMIVID